jgi:hypothetical protein
MSLAEITASRVAGLFIDRGRLGAWALAVAGAMGAIVGFIATFCINLRTTEKFSANPHASSLAWQEHEAVNPREWCEPARTPKNIRGRRANSRSFPWRPGGSLSSFSGVRHRLPRAVAASARRSRMLY